MGRWRKEDSSNESSDQDSGSYSGSQVRHSNKNVEPNELIDHVVAQAAALVHLSREEHLTLKLVLFENYIRSYPRLQDAIQDEVLDGILHPLIADALGKVMCEMDEALSCAAAHPLDIVEDASLICPVLIPAHSNYYWIVATVAFEPFDRIGRSLEERVAKILGISDPDAILVITLPLTFSESRSSTVIVLNSRGTRDKNCIRRIDELARPSIGTSHRVVRLPIQFESLGNRLSTGEEPHLNDGSREPLPAMATVERFANRE